MVIITLLHKLFFLRSLTIVVFFFQNCSSDQEKLLKFKAKGREFAKILKSQDQFIRTVKGQNNF